MRPAPLLPWLLLAWTALGIAASLGAMSLAAWATAGLALALAAAADAWRLRRQPSPGCERDLPAVLPLGPEVRVGLRLRATGTRAQAVDLHDLHPGAWAVRGLPRTLRLQPGGESTVEYAVTPDARGQFVFAGCQARLRSPWGLWSQRRVLGEPSIVRVYPNFAPLATMAGLSVELASRSAGARLQRRRGEGTEFQELRDYRVGDSLRRIDWKATARRRRLTSREYRDERNQQVVLLLDCGRRMLARDGATSHFDHVLNASLALAYIALRQDDAVGLLACSGTQQRWLPPQRGSGGMDMLLGAGYDLQAIAQPTDYLAAASALEARQQRRALVVVVTNVRDEDDAELRAAVALLARRHLVLVASLREVALDQAATEPDGSLEGAILGASAMHYLAERARTHAGLQAEGVSMLDVRPEQLSGALIERYLALKRGGRV